jgi:hypothetical protein
MPNKTEALKYLDGGGTLTARDAHTTLRWPCHYREYIVGPLPIDNGTSVVMPLGYVYSGNGTQDVLSCLNQEKLTAVQDMSVPGEDRQGWTGKALPSDDRATPVAILPDGPRHRFDPHQNFMSWSKMLSNFLFADADSG